MKNVNMDHKTKKLEVAYSIYLFNKTTKNKNIWFRIVKEERGKIKNE